MVAMKFCIWHDSCTDMACAKSDSDMIPYYGVTLQPIFDPTWITMENSFVKWAPELNGWKFADDIAKCIFLKDI